MKFLLSTLFIFSILLSYGQNILVADNNPNAPAGAHVYNTLQAAIDAAVPGDIIHVVPSATEYDGATISVTTDSISIFGIGFNPQKDGPQVATVSVMRVSASNVRISGLNFNDYVYVGYLDGNYSGVTIENCSLNYVDSGTSANITVSNLLVRGCIFNRDGNDSFQAIDFSDRVNQSVITNCVIVGYHSTSNTEYGDVVATNGTIIKNCIFFGDGRINKPVFEDLTNCTISNNIFFGKYPGAASFATFENNVFNNNVAVGTPDPTLPPTGTGSGNSGTGNFTSITDSTSIFTDPNIAVPEINNVWEWSFLWDPEVANPSLVSGGTDGTDVGVKGATIPYSPFGTPLPLIKRLIVPEVIRQGDNLDATIEAEGY